MTIQLRNGLLSLLALLVISCGGGGGGGGGAGGGGAGFVGPSTLAASGSPGDSGPGAAAGATGPGAAANGIGGIASDEGATASAAGGGDDASGVGSGGTGVSTADATGVGAVDGAGSIIVNGLRYDTQTAVGNVEDAPAGLQLGMSARVIGPVNASFTQGIARRVESAADIRGPVTSVDAAHGSFVVLGTTVTTDEATVWADAAGLAAIPAGATVQVWGLPSAPGALRATRVEQREPSATPILTGTVQNLDTARRSFSLGGRSVDYAGAVLSGSPDGQALANGIIVRVRATAAATGNLAATLVQWWYPLPTVDAATAQFAGVVTEFAGPGSLRVLGYPVDASAAQVSGGPAGAIGNGVKVEVGGSIAGGVLRATKLKIRNVPGTGGPASFDLIGTVGAFRSPSDFRVRGQPVNAGGTEVLFFNGSAAKLGNGVRVNIHGTQVVDGVLTAATVTFE
ncbi:DUF5666 domain-containing protein [Variovorax sp. J22P271]|uniref:DUF5666 domain-containing protein n=1 Tax=Variovorax davisae TaxID=3053515 RepID=UPI002578CE84|nr:DUF5666 domain-containing protein [Variovorax sp. J22P271]MDM0034738.1 DUF5666 domain-containing protein [Variovorax sp. J22P271]